MFTRANILTYPLCRNTLCMLLLLLTTLANPAQAQTAFTYSGRLVISGTPANGSYDFKFTLYTASSAGSVVGSPLIVSSVNVSSGNYTVSLDFGATSFANAPLWMQEAYRASGTTTWTNITGRVLETARFSLLSLLSENALAIGGYPVSSAAPSSGQALIWNGNAWAPATVSGGGSYQAGAGLALNGNVFSIANAGVVSSMLANGAVTSAAIANGAVTSSAIASGAVNTSALANSAVTSAKLASGSVTSSALAAGAVTNSALASAVVTPDKISSSGASSGQALTYNGSAVVWGTISGSFSLPYSGSGTNSNALFSVTNTGSGQAVKGIADNGWGVWGTSASGIGGIFNGGQYSVYANGGTDGVYAFGGTGVVGESSSAGSYGGYFDDNNGNGVYGASTSGDGGVFSGGTYGVYATSSSPSYAAGGFSNTSNSGNGVSAYSNGGDAVYGQSTFGAAGYFNSTSGGDGVDAYSTSGDGIYAQSDTGYAGYFRGNLSVSGTLYAGAKNFKIDHPLDPTNKYLLHSCIESADMKNLYDGVVTTDTKGDAVVDLPDWFEALNKDFRYQLTVIGQFAQAVISQEIANHRFAIKTDKPNVKVSWQVTGIRQDAYAKAHPLEIEQDKPKEKRGKFLHPGEYGQPDSMGEDYARSQRHSPHEPSP